MKRVVLGVLFLGTLGFDWSSDRGNPKGTLAAAGTGSITGTPGGFPVVVSRLSGSVSGAAAYLGESALIGEFDDTVGTDLLVVVADRVERWSGAPTMSRQQRSDAMPEPALVGVYDVDGDSFARELVVAATGVGGGIFVLDSGTLEILWAADDIGYAAGADVDAVRVHDFDADGASEIAWASDFAGLPDVQIVGFPEGFGAEESIQLDLPVSSATQAEWVLGDFGLAAVHDTSVTLVRRVESTATGAACSSLLTYCFTSSTTPSVWATGLGPKGYLRALDTNPPSFNGREVVIAGVDSTSAPSLTAVTPGAANPRTWQWRYGAVGSASLSMLEGELRLANNADRRIVAVGVYNSTTADTLSRAGLSDVWGDKDCINIANGWGTAWLDAATGVALAGVANTRPIGGASAGTTKWTEAWLWKTSGAALTGLEARTLTFPAGQAYPPTSACSAGSVRTAGLTSFLRSTSVDIAGVGPLAARPVVYPGDWSQSAEVRTPLVDLSGDGAPEVLVRTGTEMAAYRMSLAADTIGINKFASRQWSTMGTCDTLASVSGSGASARLLFTSGGDGSCVRVLDAAFNDVAAVDFVSRTPQYLISGAVDRPIWSVGRDVFDANSSSAVDTLDADPVLFADFDGDGFDDALIVDPTPGDFVVAVERWDNATKQFELLWLTDAASLGASAHGFGSDDALVPRYFTTGHFNGDATLDIAVYAEAISAPQTPGSGRLVFLSGPGNAGSGAVLGSTSAPMVVGGALRGGALLAADVYNGASPGADGLEEVVLPTTSGVAVYSLAGHRASWAYPNGTASEVLLADFDGDAGLEVGIFESLEATDQLSLDVREITGATTPGASVSLSSPAGSWSGFAAAHVAGEAADDLVVVDGEGILYQYTGARVLRGAVSVGADFPVGALAVGDVDGDGEPEAVVGTLDGRVRSVDLGVAGPSLGWQVSVGEAVRSVRIFDADGDAKLDVVVSTADGAVHRIDGRPAEIVIVTPELGACLSDVDADGAAVVVEGLAVAADTVEVFVDDASQGTAGVNDEMWTLEIDALTEVVDVELRVEALRDGVVVATDAIDLTHRTDGDRDGSSECEDDCNDADAAFAPDATDIDADGIDSDCDGLEVCFVDDDGDAFGHPADQDIFVGATGGTTLCTVEGASTQALATDCDDDEVSGVTVHPGATEVVADGVDQDCDEVDACFQDADNDGYGTATAVAGASLDCVADAACSDVSTDCNDAVAAIHPGAAEGFGDAIDSDCDGGEVCLADVDGDTYAGLGVLVSEDVDCDDAGEANIGSEGDCDDDEVSGATVYPGAPEAVADGVDQDCDGVDACYTDADDDGFGTLVIVDALTLDCATDAGRATRSDDCADSVAAVHPGAADTANGWDDDCDQVIDEGSPAADDDGDGISEAQGDCDDGDPAVAPGAVEVANSVDDDCDGRIDDGTDAFDDDGDGFAEVAGDCDDTTAAVAPDRVDGCTDRDQEPVDDNCNGTEDEDCTPDVVEEAGCGCTTQPAVGSMWPAVVAASLVFRRRRNALALLLGVASGCASGDLAARSESGKPFAAEPTLNLGQVAVGGEASGTLTIRNIGRAAFTVESVAFDDAEVALTDAAVEGASVGREGSGTDFLDIPVRWVPSAPGVLEATVTLGLLNARVDELPFTVFGIASAPDVRFVPGVVDFFVGGPVSREVVLWNAGPAPVSLAAVVLPAAPFSVASPALVDGATLAADGEIRFSVAWTPSATAAQAGALAIELREGEGTGATAMLPLRAQDCASPSLVQDMDGDGFTVCGGDCDDSDAAVVPGVGDCVVH